MTNDILLELRRDLIRINRSIRKELARPRPDLLKIIDLRRLERACTERLGKATAAMRLSHRSSRTTALQGAAR